MRFDVITLFPELVSQVSEYGVVGRAYQQGIFDLEFWNPRDDTTDAHRSVDDRPYGGGPGMVMKVEPLCGALKRARDAAGSQGHTILLSPQGRLLDQAKVQELAKKDHLLLVAGRYEGVDERFVTLEVDEECSIGNYVLSGGELAVMVLVDAITRMLPGVLGDADSAEQDSFMNSMLDCPHYTRPDIFHDLPVPEVLKNGDHAAIAEWRLQQGLGRTWLRRPELLNTVKLDDRQQALLDSFLQQNSVMTRNN